MARFIINAGGVINSVNDADFPAHLDAAQQTAMQRKTMSGGAVVAPEMMPREATTAEIAAWWAGQGFTFDAESGEVTSTVALVAPSPAGAPEMDATSLAAKADKSDKPGR